MKRLLPLLLGVFSLPVSAIETVFVEDVLEMGIPGRVTVLACSPSGNHKPNATVQNAFVVRNRRNPTTVESVTDGDGISDGADPAPNSIHVPLQNQLLAYAIPALSAPAGRTEFTHEERMQNWDMNTHKPDVWCRNHRIYGKRWLHSDIQNVGYFYTHGVFNSFVEQGDLK